MWFLKYMGVQRPTYRHNHHNFCTPPGAK